MERINTPRTTSRRVWIVCGLLLLASSINYMDRQTLANAAVRITREFSLNHEQYGNLEAWFGYAFAAGSLFFGFLADRLPLRWLYAAVVALWSMAGFMTGTAESHQDLLLYRTLLGFCEGGHWPCAIKATRVLLDARDRSLGNSVLQSGTSVGAIITPLLMQALMTPAVGSWRGAFQIIALIGVAWIVLWLIIVRKSDLVIREEDAVETASDRISLWRVIVSRRMLVIFGVIACINTTWQIMRAWLPKFLQEGRGWTESDALYFNSAWFVATDIGCLGAGAAAVWLARRGLPVTRARLIVFSACGLLVLASALAPFIEQGAALIAVLMIAGAGALGLFPIYHAFTQDISGSRQGRITGIASVAAWVLPAWAQRGFGWLADTPGSFNTGFIAAAFLPLLAAFILVLGWGRDTPSPSPSSS
jgi:ACS family hexuronate transporter-like MFS transporter